MREKIGFEEGNALRPFTTPLNVCFWKATSVDVGEKVLPIVIAGKPQKFAGATIRTNLDNI